MLAFRTVVDVSRAKLSHALLLLALLSHCGRSRTVDDLPDTRSDPDSGVSVDTGTGLADAAIDVPVIDAGGCTPTPLNQACFGVGAFDERAFTIRSTECACGGTFECLVDVLRPASGDEAGEDVGALAIQPVRCDVGICRACTGPVLTDCTLPSEAPSGVYEVFVEGAPVYEIDLRGHGSSEPNGSVCQTAGSTGGGLCETFGEDDSFAGDELCFPSAVNAGQQVEFVLRSECTSCVFEPGPCEVSLVGDRSGPSYSVSARVRSCDEGSPTWGCTGECSPLERRCVHPDSREGTRPVFVGGRRVGEILVVPAADPSPMPFEVCVSLAP
ncbi:MAG: hypothetical protein AAGE52_31610 [Myxococcota bacterium]